MSTASHEDTVVTTIDSANVMRRVLVLADGILGTSERRVFHARCISDGDPEHLDTLAAELGVSRERIYQLDASAKRKIAAALVVEGLSSADPMAVVADTRVRAIRRSGHGKKAAGSTTRSFTEPTTPRDGAVSVCLC
jgi:hypothetical protein